MKYDEGYLHLRMRQLRQLKNTSDFITNEIYEHYKGRAIVLNEEHPQYDELYNLIYRKLDAYPVFDGIQSGSPYVVTIRLVDKSGSTRPWNVPIDAIQFIE